MNDPIRGNYYIIVFKVKLTLQLLTLEIILLTIILYQQYKYQKQSIFSENPNQSDHRKSSV